MEKRRIRIRRRGGGGGEDGEETRCRDNEDGEERCLFLTASATSLPLAASPVPRIFHLAVYGTRPRDIHVIST
jgi:hypothetical protein